MTAAVLAGSAVGYLAAMAGLSSNLRSFLATFVGVIFGVYGPKWLKRSSPKSGMKWSK
ncbi:hypothetical protein H5J25_08695 [Sphingomonas aliaeris]|uniref:Uncharacterized protein n=1 Tax=Sphingomonas aliaeris TaxID=2759526 RepID=A0A974NXE8_9SPHN|nr:hypothetical protein [Sphingomonas aliaeris]QQV78661.1 hypothetical protein H5J25_08695 [Sphingomonas aliaeris]